MGSPKVLILFLVLLILFVRGQEDLLRSDSSELIRKALSARPLLMQMKVSQAPINFTSLFFEEDETYFYAVQQPNIQLLFVRPYSKFYTFRRLTQNFAYPTVVLNEAVLGPIVANISQTNVPDLIATHDLYKFWMKTLLTKILREGSFVPTKSVKYSVCMLSFNIYEDEFDASDNEYSITSSFYCCGPDAENDNIIDCKFVNEGFVYTIIQVSLYCFRLFFVGMIVHQVNKALRYLHAKDYFLENVTNWTYVPPVYTATFVPNLRPLVYNSKYWIIIGLALLHLAIYVACIVHSITPVSWQKDGVVISPENAIRYNLVFYLILPLLFIVNICITVIKAFVQNAPNSSDNDDSSDAAEQVTLWRMLSCVGSTLERIVRFVIIAIIAGFFSWIITLFIIRLQIIDTSRAIASILTGIIHFVGLVIYLLLTPSKTWIPLLSFQQEAKGVQHNIPEMQTPQTPHEDSEDENDQQSLLQKPERRQQTTATSLLLRYLKYKVPTWIFEMIWLTSLFIPCFIAATVLIRAVWSTLLLFILDPMQVQLYLYIISLATTIWKFFNDLSTPYQRIKAYLVEKKDSKSINDVIKNNEKVIHLTEQSIKDEKREAKEQGEEPPEYKYYIILSWRRFMQLCDMINVAYLLRAVMVRLILTIFILCIYFLGTSMFDVRANVASTGKLLGGGSSIVLGLFAAGLYPIFLTFDT
jgi:hypothetical protein